MFDVCRGQRPFNRMQSGGAKDAFLPSHGALLKYVFCGTSDTDMEAVNKANLSSPPFACDSESASPNNEDFPEIHAFPKSGFIEISELKGDGLKFEMTGSRNEGGPKVLPFEFRALEACLEAACSCLEMEVGFKSCRKVEGQFTETYMHGAFTSTDTFSPKYPVPSSSAFISSLSSNISREILLSVLSGTPIELAFC
eukprot:Gb_26503 [translate_table: standard]